jgi:hypothetical protein
MLPPETDRVWQFMIGRPELAGFVLVGGSALSLRIGHRISEDLDLAFSGSQLPRHRLDLLVAKAREAGHEFEPNDDEAAVEEFAQGGMELRDHQQDFLVNQIVKVSFFVPDHALSKVLRPGDTGGARIADLTELFRSKCLVSARRSKTRDWLDLYILLKEHGFTWKDYADAFRDAAIPTQVDIGLARLCAGTPAREDEGYAHLLDNAPTIAELTRYFRDLRDQREVEAASEATRERRETSGDGSASTST